MQLIKVGLYRKIIIAVIIVAAVISGYLVEPIAFMSTGLICLFWLIFELNILFQVMLGTQRMLAQVINAISPPQQEVKKLPTGNSKTGVDKFPALLGEGKDNG